MSALTVTILDSGEVRVSVNGVVVGLIDEISVQHKDGSAPKVKIKMKDLNVYERAELRDRLLVHLHQYREILQSLGCVELFDSADTLPQGIPAVQSEHSEG